MPLFVRETDRDPTGALDPWSLLPLPEWERGAGRSVDLFPGTVRAALRWVQRDATRRSVRRAVEDACEGAARVVRSIRLPTRRVAVEFLTQQLLVNLVAWTAGLVAAGLTSTFFEVRGFRNLWGLTASRSRTLVTADDYRLIMSLTSFCAGLPMMVFVRHFIVRWIGEVRGLRLERSQGRPAAPDARSAPAGRTAQDFDDFEFDPDP